MAVYDAVKPIRPELAFLANADAHRVNPRLGGGVHPRRMGGRQAHPRARPPDPEAGPGGAGGGAGPGGLPGRPHRPPRRGRTDARPALGPERGVPGPAARGADPAPCT
ncbi:MAG: hypothetical protein WDM92_14970 [Caulobacteraceae bacterium]